MKNLLNVSLFAMGVVLASGAYAATGTGHAQAELSTPLSVSGNVLIHFGEIAIDPAAGPQSVSMDAAGASPDITCPPEYRCGGGPQLGYVTAVGAPSTNVDFSLLGSTATLSDGLGNTIVFDPIFVITDSDSESVSSNAVGNAVKPIGGTISFTGTEPAGIYSSSNSGGSPYTVVVNY